jgi:hypothetical protein
MKQCCGYGLDPDSRGSLDPDSQSESRRAKIMHKKFIFEELDVLGFSYSLFVLYGGL